MAVYGGQHSAAAYNKLHQGTTAKVVSVNSSGMVEVRGASGEPFWTHPKQLRRLRPKPRREWTVEARFRSAMPCEQCGGTNVILGPALKPGETVRVKECKERKK